MLISPTKTINKLQINENSSRKALDYSKKQSKPCRAQNSRIAAQKSVGSILHASPHPRIQSSLAPGGIHSEGFHPTGKGRSWIFAAFDTKDPTVLTSTEPSWQSHLESTKMCLLPGPELLLLWTCSLGLNWALTPNNQACTADAYAFRVIVADPRS